MNPDMAEISEQLFITIKSVYETLQLYKNVLIFGNCLNCL